MRIPVYAHIFMAVETHVRGASLDAAHRTMKHMGWEPHSAPATQSDTSATGTYGGATLGVKHHIYINQYAHQQHRHVYDGHFVNRNRDGDQ